MICILRKVLVYLKNYKVRINLLGSEESLIKNLDEVIAEIKKMITLLYQYYLILSYVKDILILEDKDILYVEHNILDWYEDKVKKLGNFDYVPENDKNNFNVVVKNTKLL